jgi:hypothetical protein
VPEREEDSLKYRQWITLRHESIGDLFGYWTGELKKKYPNIYTSTMLMVWTSAWTPIAPCIEPGSALRWRTRRGIGVPGRSTGFFKQRPP